MGLDCTINEHRVIGMHHVKSLDASTEHLHHRYGAWSRQCGSTELVRGAHLLVSTSQNELPHEVKELDCTIICHLNNFNLD